MPRMRIGVNLAYLRPSAVGGSEVYVRALIGELARNPDVVVTAYCWEFAAEALRTLPGLSVRIVCKADFRQVRRFVIENFKLAPMLTHDRVDVLFSPANYGAPLLPVGIPQVATIHDLQHESHPGNFALTQRLARAVFVRATIQRCKRVIAISEFTREDLLERYRLRRDKVVTVHEGVDRLSPPTERERRRVRRDYGLTRGYLYYPASMAPHKNHSLLADVMKRLAVNGQSLDLVLTGARTETYVVFMEKVRREGLAGRVRHLGFVPREDVFCLMADAEALVFPSEFEGFGLPLLEAMQCGTPVVAARRASIPEVVGDAAILLEPQDVGGWVNAIKRLLADRAYRGGLVEKGYGNVLRFSWQRCAEETLAVFRDVARV